MAVLFYNKDLFRKNGLVYPSDKWNWDDYRITGSKLTKDTNNDGKLDQFGIYRNSELLMLFQQKDIRFVEEDGKTFIGDRYKKELMATLNYYIDLDKKYKAAVPTLGQGAGGMQDIGPLEAFSAGKRVRLECSSAEVGGFRIS